MGGPPCSGVGLRWSDDELNTAMDGQVAAVLLDDEGKAIIEDILAGLFRNTSDVQLYGVLVRDVQLDPVDESGDVLR